MGGVSYENKASLVIKRLGVDSECPNQVMLTLIWNDSADKEPVARAPGLLSRGTGKGTEVRTHGKHLDPFESDRHHLSTVEV
jgi:hypothetical protein